MNSRCICTAMCGGFAKSRQRMRMKVPGYPSNREADERAMKPLLEEREGAQVG